MKAHFVIFAPVFLLLILLALPATRHELGAQPASAQGAALLRDGNFEGQATSAQLREDEKTGGWFESRMDGKAGPRLLRLSKKPVGNNATQKALIKGSSKRNTYLTQALSQPQNGRFSLQWDICVKRIGKTANRSAFQLIGNDDGKGPNGTGTSRFVFLAFQNGTTPGKIDLVAMDGNSPKTANQRTVVVPGLAPETWYTVKVDVNVPGKTYAVTIPGVTRAPVVVKAFEGAGKGAPSKLTHVSFASWNDGPGTFYIDNVR